MTSELQKVRDALTLTLGNLSGVVLRTEVLNAPSDAVPRAGA